MNTGKNRSAYGPTYSRGCILTEIYYGKKLVRDGVLELIVFDELPLR
jgi:hypothetical protein